jgi:DNA-binding transcriptional regulator YdaS (Cro superfamily)
MKKPNARKALLKAFKIVGKSKTADACGIKYQSLDRMLLKNQLPHTEYSGNTSYASAIEKATGGQVTITDLLGFVPFTQTEAFDGWSK